MQLDSAYTVDLQAFVSFFHLACLVDEVAALEAVNLAPALVAVVVAVLEDEPYLCSCNMIKNEVRNIRNTNT